MATITTRTGKGSALTNTEMDANLTNLNTDKLETADVTGSFTALTGGATGASQLGTGTTAERPTPATGQLRFNTTTTSVEVYDGSSWGAITGGGGSSNITSEVLFEHANELTSSYTIGTNNNAIATTFTVGSGGSLTIPSGSILTIV
mgnify:CR=1 FL=1